MLSKLTLLVLAITMALMMACSDGSNGESDQALIDSHFAPFSLLADSCELISLADPRLKNKGAELKAKLEYYYQFNDYTIVLCKDESAIARYKQELAWVFDSGERFSLPWPSVSATKQELYDNDERTNFYSFHVSTEPPFDGAYLLVWAAVYGWYT